MESHEEWPEQTIRSGHSSWLSIPAGSTASWDFSWLSPPAFGAGEGASSAGWAVTTALRAVDHLLPHPSPLAAPGERSGTHRADLGGAQTRRLRLSPGSLPLSPAATAHGNCCHDRSEPMAQTGRMGRLSITLSISPYSTASAGDMKKSRSVSSSMRGIGWPVRSASSWLSFFLR